ncbi:PRC-barrel domain-containing protein [uncultured Cytophaga sp.]|uniref:PRC-barrel domain-containing protein n=1 Tax=uncultured Cytophaga sp. TaxID=160238 RepID=UPI00260F818B|nr:PRC-barrel domain-containing protein [uncultured Cytophaga sp.]
MSTFEQDNKTGKNHEGVNANWPVKYLTASSITGDDVLNEKGEKIGVIKDVMLDIHRGLIEYVVVECSGFLGFNDRFFALPFAVFRLNQAKRAFVIHNGSDLLKKAPGFDKAHWPLTNSHNYAESKGFWDNNFMGPSVGIPY